MKKKAFTIIELAIVLIIIALVLGGTLSIGKTAYKKNQLESTKVEMKIIKTALVSYASTYGKLPYPDTDGDGEQNSTAELGDIPYIDLQIKSTDEYGMKFKYDVWDNLANSDDSNICSILKDINISAASTDYPKVADDGNNIKYPLAAIIISRGENKILTGENNDSDRIYEMGENRYHNSENDDIVVELSVYELLGSICDLTDFNSSN